MIPNVLKSKQNQDTLNEFGFIKIELLQKDDLNELENIYSHFLSGESIEWFTSTNMLRNIEWRQKVADKINSVIKEKLADKFEHVKLWNPAFLIKPAGENTEFKIHQDWTFVEEDKFHSGNIWIPLQDTNATNGTLHFLPRSHYKFLKSLRMQGVPYFFEGHEEFIKSLCVPVNVNAGEALVFYHSTIHYSTPNLSGKPRIAIASAFNSSATGLKFFIRTSENEVEEYAMPDNYVFYFENAEAINKRPQTGQLVRKFNYIPHPYTREELLALLNPLF